MMITQSVASAHLDTAQLAQVRALEDKLGTWVVAVERQPRFAQLSEEQLRQLQAAEKEMGLILLAYERA